MKKKWSVSSLADSDRADFAIPGSWRTAFVARKHFRRHRDAKYLRAQAREFLFASLAPRALQHLADNGLSIVLLHLQFRVTLVFRSYTSPRLICASCGWRLIQKGLAVGLVQVESGGVRALERRRNETIRRIRKFW